MEKKDKPNGKDERVVEVEVIKDELGFPQPPQWLTTLTKTKLWDVIPDKKVQIEESQPPDFADLVSKLVGKAKHDISLAQNLDVPSTSRAKDFNFTKAVSNILKNNKANEQKSKSQTISSDPNNSVSQSSVGKIVNKDDEPYVVDEFGATECEFFDDEADDDDEEEEEDEESYRDYGPEDDGYGHEAMEDYGDNGHFNDGDYHDEEYYDQPGPSHQQGGPFPERFPNQSQRPPLPNNGINQNRSQGPKNFGFDRDFRGPKNFDFDRNFQGPGQFEFDPDFRGPRNFDFDDGNFRRPDSGGFDDGNFRKPDDFAFDDGHFRRPEPFHGPRGSFNNGPRFHSRGSGFRGGGPPGFNSRFPDGPQRFSQQKPPFNVGNDFNNAGPCGQPGPRFDDFHNEAGGFHPQDNRAFGFGEDFNQGYDEPAEFDDPSLHGAPWNGPPSGRQNNFNARRGERGGKNLRVRHRGGRAGYPMKLPNPSTSQAPKRKRYPTPPPPPPKKTRFGDANQPEPELIGREVSEDLQFNEIEREDAAVLPPPVPQEPVIIDYTVHPGQDRLDRWLGLKAMQLRPALSRKPSITLSVHHARSFLLEGYKMLESLQKLKELDPEGAKASEIKGKLSDVLNLLDDQAVDKLAKRLDDRRRKRANRREREDTSRAEAVEKREALHAKIDAELTAEKERLLTVEREREMRKNADKILCEVRKKLASCTKALNVLTNLNKLRAIRKKDAEKKGYQVPEECNKKFEEKMKETMEVLTRQYHVYTGEEQTLKVMLESENAQTRKKARAAYRERENRRRQRQSQRVLRSLFGEPYSGTPEDPIYPFYAYYTSAERDMETFLQIRREWDVFLVPDGTIYGSSIPPGWVQAPDPTSDAWASTLS